jgi:hypothetical protein
LSRHGNRALYFLFWSTKVIKPDDICALFDSIMIKLKITTNL